MPRFIHIAVSVSIVAGAFAAGQGRAQDERRLVVDVGACLEIDSPELRFECYERRVAEALGARAPQADAASRPVQQPAAPASAGAATARVDRTATRVAAPAEEAQDVDDADDAPEARPSRRERRAAADAADAADEAEEILGIVAEVRETVPNSYVIVLEDGQVWRQTRPKFYPLRPGHEVRLYPTNWGSSYRLAADELGSFIQVQKVR